MVYDRAGHLIAETNDAGATLREYIWLNERPIAVIDDVDTASPQLYFVHVDHLERPVMMTDATKAVVWQATFEPFGSVHAISGAASLNARFPGQWFMLESGLHYNWHRYYDPTTGRYTTPDPLGLIDGPSVYGYAGGSPLMWVDPDGRWVALAGRAAHATAKFLSSHGKSAAWWLFRPGSYLNSGRYCRIGYGRNGGHRAFRAAGEWIQKFNKLRGHPERGDKIDFIDLGPL